MGINKSYHIQGKKGSRFRDQLRGVNLEQVLIVSIDAAKLHQKALICNFYGDLIEHPFFFSVNKEGIKSFIQKVEKAKTEHNAILLLFGVEATGHYYEDIVRILGTKGYKVDIYNAYTTSEERASALNWCKTDDLDLVALAHAIMNNKGTQSKLAEGSYRQLQVLTRYRRQEVNKRASLKMEIRVLMDVIWREFQGFAVYHGKKRVTQKIFSDFWGKASVFLMTNYPHPSDILSLGELGLRKLSKGNNLKLRTSNIQRLLYAAEQACVQSKDELFPELLILENKLKDLETFKQHIEKLEQKVEEKLLNTDGRLLLTIPGLGVVSAAELYSEIGDISNIDSPSQLIKRAGTNPLVKQSGGDDGFSYYGKISKQGNPHFRYVIYNVGRVLSLHNKDLHPFYDRLKKKGKHSRKVFIAMGNKALKIAFALLRDQKPFQSKDPSYKVLHEINKKLKYQVVSMKELSLPVAA